MISYFLQFGIQLVFHVCFLFVLNCVNGKIKCRKSVKINIGFPTFYFTIYKYNNPTKDGRCWLFRVNYKDSLNNNRRYTSKKYATKFEAKEAERKFLNELDNNSNIPSKMTLGDLWDKYLEFQSDKVRINTRRSYIYTQESLKILFNIKCSEFNISHYDK